MHEVRLRFYTGQPTTAFQRDRRRLLQALTWPAFWLERRGLYCSPERYRALIVARLDAMIAFNLDVLAGTFRLQELLVGNEVSSIRSTIADTYVGA